jgi:putative NADPH-quinone reductase
VSFTVVVQAHPLEDSYNAALRAQVLATLSASAGSSAASELACFRLGQGEQPGPEVLAQAQRLVLVYPTWSGGLPAALLQWVHDTLDQPRSISGVTELVAVTTCGSSRFVNLLQGEWGKRYLKTALLACCAPGARFRWLARYKVDRSSRTDMARHLDVVGRRLTTGPARR